MISGGQEFRKGLIRLFSSMVVITGWTHPLPVGCLEQPGAGQALPFLFLWSLLSSWVLSLWTSWASSQHDGLGAARGSGVGVPGMRLPLPAFYNLASEITQLQITHDQIKSLLQFKERGQKPNLPRGERMRPACPDTQGNHSAKPAKPSAGVFSWTSVPLLWLLQPS